MNLQHRKKLENVDDIKHNSVAMSDYLMVSNLPTIDSQIRDAKYSGFDLTPYTLNEDESKNVLLSTADEKELR